MEQNILMGMKQMLLIKQNILMRMKQMLLMEQNILMGMKQMLLMEQNILMGMNQMLLKIVKLKINQGWFIYFYLLLIVLQLLKTWYDNLIALAKHKKHNSTWYNGSLTKWLGVILVARGLFLIYFRKFDKYSTVLSCSILLWSWGASISFTKSHGNSKKLTKIVRHNTYSVTISKPGK